MGTSVDRWKGVIPVWVGVAIAWGGGVSLAVVLDPQWVLATIVAATLLTVSAGVLITRRLLARNRQTLITPMDLRRR